jgi:UDP:flavonoid glycosyltransferase YjiC (YdhE family)
VRVATHDHYRRYVLDHGLQHATMPLDPVELFSGVWGSDWLASGNNPLRFMSGLAKVGRAAIPHMSRDAQAACADADAVVFTPLGMVAHHIAEQRGIPSFLAALQPITPTTRFPSVLAPAGLRLGGGYNLVSHLATEQAFWLPWRRQFNHIRREQFALPPMRFGGVARQLRRQGTPHLYGFSPLVVPPPEDWPGWAHVTGYWFPAASNLWDVPEELQRFLDDGPEPVCVGFSSLKVDDAEALTRTVMEALRRAGQRGVLLSGWGALRPGQHGDDMLVIDSAPHDYLFERVSAVVHPGGAGTCAAALRAGIPSVVVPGFSDQFFWAQRLQQLGVAPPPLRWRDLGAAELGRTIERVVTDAQFCTAARDARRRLRAEDGVARAVDTIQEYLAAA